MLLSLKHLKGYKLEATDGVLGSVRDLLFDDETWTVRYLVAATGPGLFGRRVLIGRQALERPDWPGRTFPVDLDKDRIKESPDIEADAPVARRHERQLHAYYGWDPYWVMALPPDSLQEALEQEDPEDVHLRSVNEVTGYHVAAQDGEIGHVEDFIAEEADWTVRFLVVDTRNWLPGRLVIVPPAWFSSFDWFERRAAVDCPRGHIEASPEYNPEEPINAAFERRLYDYYGRPVS